MESDVTYNSYCVRSVSGMKMCSTSWMISRIREPCYRPSDSEGFILFLKNIGA